MISLAYYLFLADIAHVRTFKLGCDNSSAVAFVPGGSTKPGILSWATQGLAGVPSEDFPTIALARLQIQCSAIHALLTSASSSSTNSAHVRAFVQYFVVLLAVGLRIPFRVRQPAGLWIGRRATLLQTSRPLPQRITRALTGTHVQTASVVAHLPSAIAQSVRTFAGTLFADFPVIPGRRERRRTDGVSFGTVIADEVVSGVIPVRHLGTPNRGAAQTGGIRPHQLGVFRASLVPPFRLIFTGQIPFAQSNFSIPLGHSEFGKIRISINGYVLSDDEIIQMSFFPCIMSKKALFCVNFCLLLQFLIPNHLLHILSTGNL